MAYVQVNVCFLNKYNVYTTIQKGTAIELFSNYFYNIFKLLYFQKLKI